MKKTIFFVAMLLGMCGMCCSLIAQEKTTNSNTELQAEPLKKRISISLRDVSLENALVKITEKSNIELNYVISNVFREKTISVDLKNVTVAEALMNLLNKTGTGLTVTEDGLLAIIPVNENFGKVSGVVVDKKTGDSLIGVNVIAKGTTIGASTDASGKFTIPQLSPGIYTFEASMMGYQKGIKENVTIRENETIELRFELTERVLSLGEIVVTPGHFSLMERAPIQTNSLSSEDVRDFPQMGEDIFRAAKRLPGLSANDYSAKFSVRGGEYGEVLLMLDGMELFDPFHLKMVNGGFSIVDVEMIENIDMMTGAFPAEYGKRLSGVFNMKTRTPSNEKMKTSLAISFLNSRFLSEGTFNDNKGSWQVLARRGYVDLILKLADDDAGESPVFYDTYGKVQYVLNQNHMISAHVLASEDKFYNFDEVDEESIDTKYMNVYDWVKWEAQFSDRLTAQTVLSNGFTSNKKYVNELDDNIVLFDVTDDKDISLYGLKQNWQYDISDKNILSWGFDVRNYNADYAYLRRDFLPDLPGNQYSLIEIIPKIDGTETGLYIKNRFQLHESVISEVGLRYDQATWTGDKHYSPRVNLLYSFGKRTSARFGWGKFYQSHGINELSATDRERSFYSANRADHYVVGLEHSFFNGASIRLEGYYKDLSKIRPRYYNYFDEFDQIPETSFDRITVDPESGYSKGFELYFSKDNIGKHRFWGNYRFSLVEEKINRETIPRLMDQRHTINIDYKYRPNPKWSVNLSWHFHSGWPYTNQHIEVYEIQADGKVLWDFEKEKINGSRLPAYHRMDVRLNRNFQTSKGLVSVFFEARNLYNRGNVRQFDFDNIDFDEQGNYTVDRNPEYWLPLIPSFGINWTF
ncbi:carboxypeptidase-like regulatory domain-containing protein [candidate division KSB1 bacterium]